MISDKRGITATWSLQPQHPMFPAHVYVRSISDLSQLVVPRAASTDYDEVILRPYVLYGDHTLQTHIVCGLEHFLGWIWTRNQYESLFAEHIQKWFCSLGFLRFSSQSSHWNQCMNCLRKLSVKVCLHKVTAVSSSTADLAPQTVCQRFATQLENWVIRT